MTPHADKTELRERLLLERLVGQPAHDIQETTFQGWAQHVVLTERKLVAGPPTGPLPVPVLIYCSRLQVKEATLVMSFEEQEYFVPQLVLRGPSLYKASHGSRPNSVVIHAQRHPQRPVDGRVRTACICVGPPYNPATQIVGNLHADGRATQRSASVHGVRLRPRLYAATRRQSFLTPEHSLLRSSCTW